MKREKLLKLIASLPWKTDANGYAIIKRSHLVLFLKEGRVLAADEVIHHKNESKRDDRPENLEVVTRSEHARIHKSHLPRGVVYTPELRAKRSQQMIGNKHALGHRDTEATRKAKSEGQRRRYQSQEARDRQSEIAKVGWQKWRLKQDTIH